MEFAVGNRPHISGLAFPIEGDLIAVVFQVTVQTVIGEVGLASGEPLYKGGFHSKTLLYG